MAAEAAAAESARAREAEATSAAGAGAAGPVSEAAAAIKALEDQVALRRSRFEKLQAEAARRAHQEGR